MLNRRREEVLAIFQLHDVAPKVLKGYNGAMEEEFDFVCRTKLASLGPMFQFSKQFAGLKRTRTGWMR